MSQNFTGSLPLIRKKENVDKDAVVQVRFVAPVGQGKAGNRKAAPLLDMERAALWCDLQNRAFLAEAGRGHADSIITCVVRKCNRR